MTVDTGNGGHVVEPRQKEKDDYVTATREWTLDEVDAMERAGQLLRTDFLDRLRSLSDRNSKSTHG